MSKKRLVSLLLAGVMVLSLTSCGPKEEKPGSETPNAPQIQTISKTAQGYGGEVSVTITFTDGTITDVAVTGNGETPSVGGAALETLQAQVLEAGSAEIDGVSGATGSSTGIKLATEAALKDALAAGGSDASAIEHFYTVPQKVNAQQTIDTDILVVGMGGSGTAAALSAAETMYAANGNDPSKVSVLAIDKAGKYGGTSCITADTMGINAPVYQETYHGGQNYVDADEMMADWQDFTMGDAKQDLLDLFFAESGNTIDWLISHGFDYGEGTPDGQGWGFGGPLPGFTPPGPFLRQIPVHRPGLRQLEERDR